MTKMAAPPVFFVRLLGGICGHVSTLTSIEHSFSEQWQGKKNLDVRVGCFAGTERFNRLLLGEMASGAADERAGQGIARSGIGPQADCRVGDRRERVG